VLPVSGKRRQRQKDGEGAALAGRATAGSAAPIAA